ncbi:MAG: endopeptidase La [Planctomycetota bacterium]|nr:endopeptidase La [Planctomycetota bacterium]
MVKEKPTKPKIVVSDEPALVIKPGGEGVSLPEEELRLVIPEVAAVMAIRNTTMFPGTIMPLAVGREKSRRLIDDVLPDEKVIVLVTQRDGQTEKPAPNDLYDYGTAVVVLKLLRTGQDGMTIIVHGLARVHIERFVQTDPYFRAQVRVMSDETTQSKELEARLLDVRGKALRIAQLSPNVPDEAQVVINSIDQGGALADFLAANLPLDLSIKQSLLAETNVLRRLEMLQKALLNQVEVLELSSRLQEQVRASVDKTQREYFLREQLKAIQKELGQADEQTADVQELTEKIDSAGMDEPVKSECIRQIHRLETIPPASPEYSVIRTYLEVMTELPWARTTQDNLDIRRARRILNEDHYDLDKVKKRILEYLAVRRLAPESRGPILCFAGPPGVGKTSLGKSIARALERKFIRMSLGGMRDEAELRGHRRTYIGAMPGRIIQELRKSGSANPVFMLDELDKVGMDFRGDPTSALLEILDPAQNFSFQDHYLNVPFDLSKVMFIATANIMSPVPPALRDRMEVIEISGYTIPEKLHIARKYLLPRQLTENGLTDKGVEFSAAALMEIVTRYTREAGVRELERQIGAICRGLAVGAAKGGIRKKTVGEKEVAKFLGPVLYESEIAQRTSVPGVATGLAFTPYGGEIIFVEATAYPGKGQLLLTGQIGDVMKESAQAAMSLIRSRSAKFDIDAAVFPKIDVHVHVPAGAVPKDGPSAGVSIATAICSLLMNRSVRSDVAMTGEITLRGIVLPVGGIKEKVLAAARAGIKTVIIPRRNRRNLTEISAEVRKRLKFVPAGTIDEVLAAALADSDEKPQRKKRQKV